VDDFGWGGRGRGSETFGEAELRRSQRIAPLALRVEPSELAADGDGDEHLAATEEGAGVRTDLERLVAPGERGRAALAQAACA